MAESVSVVIAAYNAEICLERAVESAGQDSVVSEILVVDDASNDGTSALAERITRRDHRVHLIRCEVNGGPSRARNLGFNAAAGEWIAVLDADDAFAPGRLEHLSRLGREHGADIMADNVCFYNAARALLGPEQLCFPDATPRRVDLQQFLDMARPFTGEMDWGLLKPVFRRGFYRSAGLAYNEAIRHVEDFHLIAEALMSGGVYLVDSRPGYFYTTRDSGLSQTSVDYEGMARMTLELLTRPAIAAHPELRQGVRNRARSVRRLASQRAADAALFHRDLAALSRLALRDPQVVRRLMALTKERLRRLRFSRRR